MIFLFKKSKKILTKYLIISTISETSSHIENGSCPITCDCGCVPKSQYCHEGKCYCNSTNLPIEAYLNEELQLIHHFSCPKVRTMDYERTTKKYCIH